MIKENYLPI
jgi:hypothetical protein